MIFRTLRVCIGRAVPGNPKVQGEMCPSAVVVIHVRDERTRRRWQASLKMTTWSKHSRRIEPRPARRRRSARMSLAQ